MNKDEQIQELSALLEQERAYANKLRVELGELRGLQHHLISGLDVWKNGFEKLFHEHHVLLGNERSTACNVCLREHHFPILELVPSSVRV
jgi:hypothetical protein